MNNNAGQHWLLLRGLARESRHWGEFINTLQVAFPQATIHTLDLAGTGQFHHQKSPNTIEEIVAVAREQALQFGFLNQPVTLLALSLGGMVAWEWMKKYPQDIDASILVNTSLASLSPFYQRLCWQNYGHIIRILGARDLFTRETAIVRLISNQSDAAVLSIARKWMMIYHERPISFSNCIRQVIAAAKYQPDNQPVASPVLVLNSLGDQLVSPNCSRAIQKEFRLLLEIHPTAGHDIPLDAPDWMIEKIMFFIAHVNK
jgi:pimeloyl-ACP methyl ester carboxylesterase